MAVEATIIVDTIDDVILVPSTAIQTANGTTTVRILKDGQPTSATVTVAGNNDSQTAISSGLNDGDTIVTGVANTSAGTNTSKSQTTTSVFGGSSMQFGGGPGR